MPLFKVELHRRMRDSYGSMPEPNPFLGGLPPDGKTVQMLVREWIFEAQDEAEVRRLLQEAYDTDVPNVRGFSLRQITRTADPTGAPTDG